MQAIIPKGINATLVSVSLACTDSRCLDRHILASDCGFQLCLHRFLQSHLNRQQQHPTAKRHGTHHRKGCHGWHADTTDVTHTNARTCNKAVGHSICPANSHTCPTLQVIQLPTQTHSWRRATADRHHLYCSRFCSVSLATPMNLHALC